MIFPKTIWEKVIHLKATHIANFGNESLGPLNILNTIRKFKLDEIFCNVCTALRRFCTLPVTVASAERSFSKLKLIKNFLRSTMSQGRLNDLVMLCIEAERAKRIDFRDIINDFAMKKARKAFC
ncbi:hypothetical protein LOD99_7974 [Oopsacas minuta]|uniref:HAT C-terminal dimerisation domain-containing protein n=1 Tax=Oopsacas minuta TaxID=111878 RepID=A0AAV7JI58_9METZ|nr:hypothetical protein LOD99_7974 [Oopsacas minuta]